MTPDLRMHLTALPPELLAHIFLFVCTSPAVEGTLNTDSKAGPRTLTLPAPLLLTHISAPLRRLVHSLPELWTTPELTLDRPSNPILPLLLDEWLARAGPLGVCVTFRRAERAARMLAYGLEDTVERAEGACGTSHAALFDVLCAYRARWAALDLYFPDSACAARVERVFELESRRELDGTASAHAALPLLRKARLWGNAVPTNPPLTFLQHAPALEELSLDGVRVTLPTPTSTIPSDALLSLSLLPDSAHFSNLTRLTLSHIPLVDVFWFLRASAITLQHVTLNAIDATRATTPPVEPLVLPRLAHLSITGTRALKLVLDALEAPALRVLLLEGDRTTLLEHDGTGADAVSAEQGSIQDHARRSAHSAERSRAYLPSPALSFFAVPSSLASSAAAAPTLLSPPHTPSQTPASLISLF